VTQGAAATVKDEAPEILGVIVTADESDRVQARQRIPIDFEPNDGAGRPRVPTDRALGREEPCPRPGLPLQRRGVKTPARNPSRPGP
jgi:hypothetical protein